ncbi:hypothetical protein APS_1871 [Acetobacter pasteurianus subsp. pasteurianus LMG 1262 = NBRC 106471]|nr:hypothetical protein APS_1871 [Acetobacter pasteurianus subsp. pasteurianus LMG 1262 = NBRC 106471]
MQAMARAPGSLFIPLGGNHHAVWFTGWGWLVNKSTPQRGGWL